MEIFVEVAKGLLFLGMAAAFFLLAWLFLRLAGFFSSAERSLREMAAEVVPLLGETRVTVDNINGQLSQLDGAVEDVAGITDELDQTTSVITRGLRGGVIRFSSTTAGLSQGLNAFFRGDKKEENR